MTDFEIKKAQAGQTIIFSNGCYSDRQTQFVGCAVKDFDILEEKSAFVAQFTEEDKEEIKHSNDELYCNHLIETQGFIEYLIRKGLLIETNNIEIHCGDYDFEIDSVKQIR